MFPARLQAKEHQKRVQTLLPLCLVLRLLRLGCSSFQVRAANDRYALSLQHNAKKSLHINPVQKAPSYLKKNSQACRRVGDDVSPKASPLAKRSCLSILFRCGFLWLIRMQAGVTRWVNRLFRPDLTAESPLIFKD